MLGNRPGLQSALQLIPEVLDRVEVEALCRPVIFFHTKLKNKTFLHGLHFVLRAVVMLYKKRLSPNCCHSAGSALLLKYHFILQQIPSIGNKGPDLNHENVLLSNCRFCYCYWSMMSPMEDQMETSGLRGPDHSSGSVFNLAEQLDRRNSLFDIL